MPRDEKGKFTKKDGFKISMNIPNLEKIINFAILLVLLMPWIIIILRKNILELIFTFFEKIMSPSPNEETETPKKGIFY